MDRIDCERTDKAISKRIEAIYSAPGRHKYYSCYDFYRDRGSIGPRGGKIIGNKKICYYCGHKEAGHAAETEQV